MCPALAAKPTWAGTWFLIMPVKTSLIKPGISSFQMFLLFCGTGSEWCSSDGLVTLAAQPPTQRDYLHTRVPMLKVCLEISLSDCLGWIQKRERGAGVESSFPGALPAVPLASTQQGIILQHSFSRSVTVVKWYRSLRHIFQVASAHGQQRHPSSPALCWVGCSSSMAVMVLIATPWLPF